MSFKTTETDYFSLLHIIKKLTTGIYKGQREQLFCELTAKNKGPAVIQPFMFQWMWYLQEKNMSLSNVPSQVDVMGWNPQNLADYMKRVSIEN